MSTTSVAAPRCYDRLDKSFSYLCQQRRAADEDLHIEFAKYTVSSLAPVPSEG